VCGSGDIAPIFFTLALDGGEWSVSRPGRLTFGITAADTRVIGDWVGPRAGLDAVGGNLFPSHDSNSGRPAPSPSIY
jgi:hypothetical protein